LQPRRILARHHQALRHDAKAELRVVAGVAHEEDQIPGRRGKGEAPAHQRPADADAAQLGVDRQGSEQKRRPVVEQEPPVADGADEARAVAGDEREAGLRLAADPVTIGGLALALEAEGEVEQPLDRRRVERALGEDVEHGGARIGGFRAAPPRAG
jgi:hypothetical protein